MDNKSSKLLLPKDSRNDVINRAMGVPIPSAEGLLLGPDRFATIFDLTVEAMFARVFIGLSIQNPSTSASIILSIAEPFSQQRDIVCPPNQFFTFDNLTFGPGIIDDTTGKRCNAVRAKLSFAQGVDSSATIDYSGSGNPTDGMLIEVDGKVFEFSDDLSKDPVHDALIPLGATADDSWTYACNVINNTIQGVTATIDTGTDIVTISSNYGGAFGDGVVIQDGSVPTGATFSGNTTGGSGGVPAIFHIW